MGSCYSIQNKNQKKKIIAVVGATGVQSRGIVDAILKDPNGGFAVRALTRNPNTEQAQELAKLGAEVVAADIDNLESLKKALEGAYGAFFVTFYSMHLNPEIEKAQAKNMAQAAKDVGLKHVIWSTLEDSRKWVPLTDNRMPTLLGKYKIPLWDGKAEADHYFTDLGVPTTFFLTPTFWDNFIHMRMGPKKGKGGELTWTFPMGNKRLGGMSVEDCGNCAYGVFKKGSKYIGKTIGVASEFLTLKEMSEKMGKALRQKVTYQEISPEVFRSFPFPGADNFGNQFQFYQEFEDVMMKHRSPELSKELNPEIKSFDDWLAENVNKIPLDPAY